MSIIAINYIDDPKMLIRIIKLIEPTRSNNLPIADVSNWGLEI